MISKPMVTPLLNGWEFGYLEGIEEGLIFQVKQARMDRNHNLTTEFTIIDFYQDYAQYKGRWKPLSGIRLNLNSMISRQRLAKELTSKSKAFPWNEIIEDVCQQVLTLYQEGEPVQELWTSDDIPELEYLLNPILIKGVPTIIFGEKGVAKSTLSLVIYLCLTLPWHDNPLGFIAPPRSVKTLILDYELPGYIAQRNIKKLVEGMGLGAIPLYHRRCFSPLADELEQVAKYIDAKKAEVIIIDSLARACGGDLNKTEPANAFNEALDKLNVTPLILAQTSKDQDTRRKTVLGSTLFTYYGRSIWELCKAETLSDNTLDIALFNRWSNLTEHHPDMGFRFTFNKNKTCIEREAVSITEFIGKVNTQKAIMEELKSGALAVKEIAERLDRMPSQVAPILTKLKKRGLLVNLEGNQWGLALRDIS